MFSIAWGRVTPIATSAAAMTPMSVQGCASASAASGSIGRSRCRSLRPSPTGPLKQRSSLPIRSSGQGKEIIAAVERELEAARYEASLAARRYELVDPAKRHVARELEARWNGALERVRSSSARSRICTPTSAGSPKIDRALLLHLAHDLPAAWNAPSTDTAHQAAAHPYPDPGDRLRSR